MKSGKLRGNEWRVLGLLAPYVLEYRWRVAVALACLVAAKLANVGVPLILKRVVDGLDPRLQAVAVPVALLAAYGALRFSTTLFAELRDVVFVRVTQRAIRRVALGVFRHLHSLSLRFHLERQTGGMTRDIERGTRGISTLLSYLLFSIIPVILEFALVAAVLLAKFDWRFAAVTFGAVAVYIAFTVAITEWRMEIRRRANELDSRANTRAIDSLLNYETVKYFGNEEYEARRYDENLRKYETAAVKNEASLGVLNIGQSFIIAAAVTVLMVLVADGVAMKRLSLGDLVLVNGLLIQLYIPLNFLGMVPQDTVLFNDTILYNIRYGRPEASDAEVYDAARAAHIHDFIAALPAGYETMVGERGLKLSGGEKQRVAIARALLKNPRILIFDEATSALDSRAEKAIQAELERISVGRTTLVIAHRLSTVMDADQILVLSHGRIVERGTHRQLLDAQGEYARMWALQQQRAEAQAALEQAEAL
jgi:ABC-type transport system involved in Fe-S cluster assembly fused permease/ATPase subunit